ncbi:hypothetical protein STTU_3728 [Streptomyces sp. Tu6071]|nr:hypothetical protein STTU_3728 [Streptomyces sp. Tu6071]
MTTVRNGAVVPGCPPAPDSGEATRAAPGTAAAPGGTRTVGHTKKRHLLDREVPLLRVRVRAARRRTDTGPPQPDGYEPRET